MKSHFNLFFVSSRLWPAQRAINQPAIPPLWGALVIVFASIVASIIMLSVTYQLSPLPNDALLLTTPRTRVYISKDDGYRVRYLKTWSYETQPPSARGEEERIVFRGDSEEIVVVTTRKPVSSETLIPSLPLELSLNGTKAFRYHDYNPSSGQPLDRVVVERPDGRFHELYGYGPYFDRFIMSFSLIP